MILFSFQRVLIVPILLALLSMTKISHDCNKAESGPKSVLHGQFQKVVGENSVSFKHTFCYRRIYITKDNAQPVWSLLHEGDRIGVSAVQIRVFWNHKT